MKIIKSKNVNLENKKAIFFQIGVIISLSLILLAFEWTTVRSDKILLDFNREILMEEELVAITEHKKDPEMPKPKIIQAIEIVPDEIEPEEEIEISMEIIDENANDLTYYGEDDPDRALEEPVIYIVAEKQPQFPGGLTALYQYLAENIKYPGTAREVGITGTVHILFVVWNDGSVRDVTVQRGIGGGCDEEAVRVIKNMPKWNPGIQRTRAVNVQMSLPVSFKLIN